MDFLIPNRDSKSIDINRQIAGNAINAYAGLLFTNIYSLLFSIAPET